VTPSEESPHLAIRAAQMGAAVIVDMGFREKVYLARDSTSMMKRSALAAYIHMYEDARAKGIPVTNADVPELAAEAEAERKGATPLPLPPLRDAVTWERHGVALSSEKPEAVPANIIARYKAEILDTRLTPPADRAIKEQLMALEVQAAIANCQRPATVTNVRDTIVGYVDEFLNEWLAANPSAIR